MSGNVDNIDLNSDVVSVEPENDVPGANVSEPPLSRVCVSDGETLSGAQTAGGVVDQVGDFKIGNDLMTEKVVDEGGFGLEAKNGVGDAEGESKDGNFDDVSVGEAATVTHVEACKVEDNSVCRVEEGNGVAGASTLIVGGVTGDGGLGGSKSSPDIVDGKVKVDDRVESLPHESANQVSTEIDSDTHENEDMKIGEATKTFVGQTSVTDDASRENDVIKPDSLSLVVDINPSVSTDENESEDENATSAAAKKSVFNVSDLVWGKVMSHPWWPGQILDPSDSTKKAKKYMKKGNYLVAYFGDQTFAWNDASRIKPFRHYFSQMVVQSNLEEFHYAIDCALDEVSRRIEFGLSCPCVPDYSNVKTQIILNAGIREECCRKDGGDSFSTAACFEPTALINYAKVLGEAPYGGVNRLEFVTAQAQLLAFNRWKGYSELPEFQNLGASLENDVMEIQPSGKVKYGTKAEGKAGVDVKSDDLKSSGKGKSKDQDSLPQKRKNDDLKSSKKVKAKEQDSLPRKRKSDDLKSSAKGKSDDQDSFPSKRKHVSGDNSNSPDKKEKSLADLFAKRHSSSPNVKKKLDSKAIAKLISSSPGKKRKAGIAISDDSALKHDKTPVSLKVGDDPSQRKSTFRVGASILRVASQLNGSTAILKSPNGTSQKSADKKKRKVKSSSGKPQGKELFSVKDCFPNEMVSQLLLVAKDPMKSCGFLKSLVGFFTEFRNSICLGSVNSQEHEQSSQEHDDNTVNESMKMEPEASISQQSEGCSAGDMMDNNIPVEQASHENQKGGGCSQEIPAEKCTATVESQSTVPLDSNLGSDLQMAEAEKLEGNAGENCDGDSSPTALILNFTSLDSIPSESNLNKIFSRYGLLKELETKVLKKSRRAKVVFHSRADAEAAFSSAGKYSIFGPALVSYRLKYMPSSNGAKGSKKGATSKGKNTL